MSFDKIKAMRNAERFLSQGKIHSAISEYKKIVENDPKDFSTMNILGDLYVKGNESSEAVSCFKQVAEHFNKQGFAQKAIAIYNKISRLQPNSVEISEKLAQLYHSRGSFAEARSHYVALAEQYQRKGQKNEALETWKQIAQLDPNNTEVYLKIAEFCLQNGQKDEAAKAYTEAGNRLASLDQTESALTAFSRALEIRQYDLGALNGFVKTQIKLGYADDAAEKLEKILEQSPYNREILYLLVDCYLDSNNTEKGEEAVIRLVEQEPANYPKLLELVEIYVKNGDLDSASRILSMTSEHLLVGGNPEEFLKWINEILAQDHEQLEALRLLVRFYGWQRDESELKKSLEKLAQAGQSQNSVDDEKYALSQLVLIVPHEISFAKRLQELTHEFGGDTGFSTTENYAESFSHTPSNSGSPTFNNEQSRDNFNQNASNSDDFETQVPEFETDEFNEHFQNTNRNSGFLDDNSENISSETFQPSKVIEAKIVSENENVKKLSLSEELRIAQEIEGIEFYIAQGYKDLAEKSIALLEEEFGARPEFAVLREKTDDSLQKLAADSAKKVKENAEEKNILETPIIEVKENKNSFDFLNEFRNELGLEEIEANNEADYETHFHTATAYKEMGLLEDSIREFQDAFNLVRADDGTKRFFQCCNLLGHCFMEKQMPNLALMWFRRALETADLHEEEKQGVLYEIANAYEKGGEDEKALQYFEQIYAVNVDYRDVGTRLEKLQVGNFAN
jgi:tetratricopeptide (TPR) repeat protein